MFCVGRIFLRDIIRPERSFPDIVIICNHLPGNDLTELVKYDRECVYFCEYVSAIRRGGCVCPIERI